MKNVTITLNEDVAAWARVEAAKEGKSLSRYLAELLSERRCHAPSQRESVKQFLSGPEFPGITTDLPSREELYAERLFHRHEHLAVHQGPEKTRETTSRPRVARRPR